MLQILGISGLDFRIEFLTHVWGETRDFVDVYEMPHVSGNCVAFVGMHVRSVHGKPWHLLLEARQERRKGRRKHQDEERQETPDESP